MFLILIDMVLNATTFYNYKMWKTFLESLSRNTYIYRVFQNPISPDNVNKAVENLTSLVESASKERLTPTDVNLVADILQNVISSGADLGQDTVEKILQTVDAVSRLPQDTLSEGQSQGRSSNRLAAAIFFI